MRRFSTGDPVIYEETRPNANAAQGGAPVGDDDDSSIICHYMTVMESGNRGTLVLLTHAGEMHVTHNSNPCVRRPSWWERFRFHDQFPQLKPPRR